VGQITAEKQIEFALSAFKKVHQAIPNTYYLIVGEQTGTANLSSVIDALGLSDYVWLTGHISDEQKFIDWIYSVDIIINLRYPTVGETSRTALCALATGRSLIVFDHGWYSELPDSTCIKVPPLDENALFTAMSQLAQQPQKRQHLGGAGQQYIEREHHPDHVAKAYVAFINQRLSSIQHKYGN
jgi:glycosyltransferase involved in cell wall biosynthesis